MKFIKSKCIQKPSGRKKGKYQITLEVSDYDVNMLEKFSITYAPFQLWEDFKKGKMTWDEFNKESSKCDFNDKYSRWIHKLWFAFCRLWRIYD